MSAKPQRYRTDLTWDLTFPVRWPDWKSANSRKRGYSNVIRNFLIYPSLLDLSKIYRGLLVLDRWLTFLDHPCWRPLQEEKACFYYIQSFQDWICCPRTIPVCVCVRACVCLYGPLISTFLVRFCWNLDHIVLTKIWHDTFLKFWQFCFDDVITVFLLFSNAALSRL